MPGDFQPKPRALWIAALIFMAIMIADSWFRWSTFQYRTFDLAFYVHTFWLTLQGQAQSTLLNVSLMGNHAEPICYLLLPFFWMWKHPMFFVVVQVLLVATMPFTAYRIARRMEFERRGALWLALATLLAPATGYMTLHEFHPETLAAPLLLLMLEARLATRVGLFWLWFLLAVACKENVALMLAWFCGVHYLIDRSRSREWQIAFNVVPGVFAAAWVAVYAVWLKPMWNPGQVDYDELYSHLGGFSGMLQSPGKTISAGAAAVTQGNLVWGLLVPFLLLPLLRPRWLIISLPIFAQHLLSWRSSEWTIHFHYAAPLLPLLWFATAEACARLYWRDVMAGWVMAACIATQVWIGPVHLLWHTVTTGSVALQSARLRAELLDAIPAEGSVLAGFPYLSHLAMRNEVYSLHRVLKGLKTLSREMYAAPPATSAVFVDTADDSTFDYAAGRYHPEMLTNDGRIVPESEKLLDAFLAQAAWRKISRNEVTLLIQHEARPSAPAASGGRVLDAHHRLIGVQMAPPPGGDAALILLTYEIQRDRKLVPWLRLYLQAEDRRQFAITKGPIALGEPGGVSVTESWAIRPPSSIPRGKYRAFLLFYDNHEAHFPGKARFEKRTFDLGEFEFR